MTDAWEENPYDDVLDELPTDLASTISAPEAEIILSIVLVPTPFSLANSFAVDAWMERFERKMDWDDEYARRLGATPEEMADFYDRLAEEAARRADRLAEKRKSKPAARP